METDPINPASSDSGPSMEIKRTDPIESEPTAGPSAIADSNASETKKPAPLEPEVSDPVPPEPITPEPVVQTAVTAEEPVVASIPTPPASEAIAERIQVAATSTAHSDEGSSEGGEWDLLSSKVRQWWNDNNFVDLWQRSRRPLLLIAGLIGLTLVIRIYSGILAAIGTIPLAPRLFELVGLVWVVWFSATKLIRTEERKALLANLSGIWDAFRGTVRP